MNRYGFAMNARHRVVQVVVGAAPFAMPLFAAAACAVASPDEAQRDEAPNVVPATDGSNDASLTDTGLEDAAPEADAPRPCAVGNLCRVPSPLTIGSVVSIAGRAKDDVWASASRGLLMRWDGQQWAALESASTEVLTSIVVGPTETWGVSGRAIVQRGVDPSSVVVSRPAVSRYFSGIAVLADGDVYACSSPRAGEVVSDQLLGKFDPAANKYLLVPDPILEGTNQAQKMAVRAMYVVPDKFIWLVGDNSRVARYRVSPVGGGVVIPLDAQVSLRAAWGYDEHLWVVGGHGTILHYDGSAWDASPSGTSVMLNAVFGLAPDDIWAAGDEGTVLHYDGKSWARVELPGLVGNLQTIWGSSADDVWIGGEGGLFHWGALQ